MGHIYGLKNNMDKHIIFSNKTFLENVCFYLEDYMAIQDKEENKS